MNIAIKGVMTQVPHTVGVNIPVEKAKSMMQEHSCHHLPVLDGGKLVGVISDRDIKLIEQTPNGEETLVSDLMTEEPVIVDPDDSLKVAVQKMLDNKINSVIVRAKDKTPWGIVTSTNVFEYFLNAED